MFDRFLKGLKNKDRKYKAYMKNHKLGRPELAMPENFDYIADLYSFGKLTAESAAKELGMSSTTFLKKLKGVATS